MPQIQPKAVFIGPTKVGDALASLHVDWEFLPSVGSIDEVYKKWEDGSLTRDLEVIFVLSRFYDETHSITQFEEFVAAFSPYCLMGIVNYDPDKTEDMRASIEEMAQKLAQGDPNFYFISPSSADVDLQAALESFLKVTEEEASDAIRVLSGTGNTSNVSRSDDAMEPAEPEEDFFEESDNDYLGKVIVLNSSKGGTGKSTTNATIAAGVMKASRESVAAGLESRPLKSIIVDIDVRDGQVGFITGLTKPTIYELHRDGLTEENLDASILHDDGLDVDVLLAARRPRQSFAIKADFYDRLIDHLKRRYDFIFFDTSVNYLEPLLAQVCYPRANHIIFVTEPVITSLFSMTRWILETTNPRNKQGFGIPKSRTSIVINKYMQDIALPAARIVRAAAEVDILAVIPSMPRATNRATNEQALETLLEIPGYAKPINSIVAKIVGDDYRLVER